MTINSNSNHNGNGKSKIPANKYQEPDKQTNLSIPPDIEQSKALFLLLERIVNQLNQIHSDQARISQRIEDLATTKPYQKELTAISERLERMEETHSQLNQTQTQLIEALMSQAINQEQLTTTMTQSLKNLKLDKQLQPEKLENLQQNLLDLRLQEIVPLKQSFNSLAQGINDLPTKISRSIRQAITPKAQSLNFNWTWGELITLAVAYSFFYLILNTFAIKVVQQNDYYQTMTYLQTIYQRLDWTNTKLQRIEKKLGTAPKK